MKRMALALLALLVAGCSSLPPAPIASGDTCTRCGRIIRDTRIASEIIDSSGRAFKFRTVACMAKHVVAKNPDASVIYVTDYASGRLVKAKAVNFVPTTVTEGTSKTVEYIAYYSSAAARTAAEREKTTPVSWDQVLDEARKTAN
jgi:hypothetical protein